jgi:hypothetical protein
MDTDVWWGWDGTPDEWMESWYHNNFHRFLHKTHFANQFESLSHGHPDLMFILTRTNTLTFTGGITPAVLDWGFLDTDVPLTERDSHDYTTSSDRIIPSKVLHDGLRFQSVFFTNDDDLPVVFDTGATISVTP